jgi:hypothetical protein
MDPIFSGIGMGNFAQNSIGMGFYFINKIKQK